MKTDKSKSYIPTAPFHKQFFKEVPMVDSNSDPIPWNPPLTDSFWKKPKPTQYKLKKNAKPKINK